MSEFGSFSPRLYKYLQTTSTLRRGAVWSGNKASSFLFESGQWYDEDISTEASQYIWLMLISREVMLSLHLSLSLLKGQFTQITKNVHLHNWDISYEMCLKALVKGPWVKFFCRYFWFYLSRFWDIRRSKSVSGIQVSAFAPTQWRWMESLCDTRTSEKCHSQDFCFHHVREKKPDSIYENSCQHWFWEEMLLLNSFVSFFFFCCETPQRKLIWGGCRNLRDGYSESLTKPQEVTLKL